MIPKIIHYCWLSNDPFPESIQRCIDSWKRVLPDYEFMLWNFERFPQGKSKWVDQAFACKKYAFAADYIRLYALHTYGGIYIDSDVEVLRSYNDLLDLPYFIGQENTPLGIEAATLGCEKGWSLVDALYDRYKDREFINPDGSMNIEPMPAIFRKCIEARYTLNFISKKEDFIRDESVINVFPVDFFSPKTWYSQELSVTNNTYSIHHFAASWMNKEVKVSVKNPYVQFVKKWIKIVLYFLKPVCIVSNVRQLNEQYYKFFGVSAKSPFIQGTFYTDDDFLQFVSELRNTTDLSLRFITDKESKYSTQISDFYPIAKIGNTDTELHFLDDLDPIREVITASWNKCLSRFDKKKIVIIFVGQNISSYHHELLKQSGYPYLIICNNSFKKNKQEVLLPRVHDVSPRVYRWSNFKSIAKIYCALFRV